MNAQKLNNGSSYSQKVNWALAQNYVQSWKRGDQVKWAGSKWTVADVSDSGALLENGSIKLTISFHP